VVNSLQHIFGELHCQSDVYVVQLLHIDEERAVPKVLSIYETLYPQDLLAFVLWPRILCADCTEQRWVV
jgi:hypothetical protein